MGFGTSVSSFLGGEFGKVYALRLNYSPDYYDSYNSYNYSSYDGYDSYFMYSPIQLDVNAGYMLNEKLSLEMESSFIWHLRGRPEPEFVTGTEDGSDYIDKYDNSTLFAIPFVVNAKFYPAGRKETPFYIKACLLYTSFFKMYFLKLGILDGFMGLVLCSLSSVHVCVKYSKLYLRNRDK